MRWPDGSRSSSPRALARQLNKEGVPGPSGKDWGQSTIDGNRERGTGILNDELCIGRLVWNRLTYIKDPDTGKRISRPNKESELIVHEVPEMRIIDQDLWDRVKARQTALETSKSAENSKSYWDRRRPQYLFSGLMKCGVCGGGVVTWNRVYLGCATARSKGTCTNMLTINRPDVGAAVLNVLRHHLMDPQLLAVFCEEYTAHMNRIRMEGSRRTEGYRAEHAKLTREIDRLIQAIMDGGPGAQVKDKIAAAESRKAELDTLLAEAKEEPIRLLPNMAKHYRDQVAGLCEALNDEDRRTEATTIIRSLVDRIVLRPTASSGEETLAIELKGHLAGILTLASKAKRPLDESGLDVKFTKLVEGPRYQRFFPVSAGDLKPPPANEDSHKL